jgi:hypothetical protein
VAGYLHFDQNVAKFKRSEGWGEIVYLMIECMPKNEICEEGREGIHWMVEIW